MKETNYRIVKIVVGVMSVLMILAGALVGYGSLRNQVKTNTKDVETSQKDIMELRQQISQNQQEMLKMQLDMVQRLSRIEAKIDNQHGP